MLNHTEHLELVEALRSGLLARELDWIEEPSNISTNWRLRLRAIIPCRSLHIIVEAYEVDRDSAFPDDDSTHVTVAFYDDRDRWLADAGFGITAYTAALTLIDNIVSERYVIEINEPTTDVTWLAKIGPHAHRLAWSRLRCYSWRRTFD